MANDLDHYWNTYNAIKNWIIFSDTKAAAIIAFYAVMGSALLPKISDIKIQMHSSLLLTVLWIILIALSLCAIVCALGCLSPQKRIIASKSLIFYRDIVERYPTMEKYSFDCQKTVSNNFSCVNDISGQVWALSKVATKKFNLTSWSVKFLFISIIPFSLILIAYLFN